MPREQLLIRTLLDLADTMVTSHDLVELLYLLCERTVDVVRADAAGVLLMDGNGRLGVAAASSRDMWELEQVEVDRHQGPCVEAHHQGETIAVNDIGAEAPRWPAFAAAAAEVGFASVHARPLRSRGSAIGAINVFRRAPGGFSDDDEEVIDGLAAMASIGIMHERALGAAEQQVSDLQRALDKRAVVDQAMAVLADRHGVDHGVAFEWLRRYARNSNQRLRDVAQRFLNGEVDPTLLTRS